MYTENDAVSYSIEGHDPRIVLFSKSVRGMDSADPRKLNDGEKYLEFLLGKSWSVSPLDTLRMIFYIRDCREGKGEKRIFDAACLWLMKYHTGELKHNIKHIPFYGSWKDLPRIFGKTKMEADAIKIHTDQLRLDKEKLGTPEEKNIDIGAAKYAPSEGREHDKKWDAVSKYASMLCVNKASYRKEYIRPLRSVAKAITEERMCANEWEEIDFSKVPSIAMKKYAKAFQKHQPERYSEFLSQVLCGKMKINVSVLNPVDIVKEYTQTLVFSLERNDTTEAQWKQFLQNYVDKRKDRSFNALPIIDVSGSMYGGKVAPIDVALSVGILTTLLNDQDSPYYRKWITFSQNPTIETLSGDSLCDIIRNINKENWTLNTNFQRVFDMILGMATMFSVPQEKMPKMLIVISDMQFDSATDNSTNWEEIEDKYIMYGYKRPIIVFWNVRSNTKDMPVPHSHVKDCILVGGYNSNILFSLLDGNIPNPMMLMRKIIDSPRYSRITLPEKG